MKLFIDFILVAGILTNGFLLIRLIKRAKNHLPFRLLALVFLLSFIILLHFYAHWNKLEVLYLLTFAIEDASRFLIGPLLFLYIKSLFFEEKNLVVKNWWHVLPFIVYLVVFSIPLSLTLGVQGYSFGYLILLTGTQNFVLGKDLFFLAYLFYAMFCFRTYRNKMKASYSSITHKDVNWIGQMLFWTTVLILIDILISLYELVYGDFSFQTGYITIIGVVLLLSYLVSYGISQTTIFLPDFLIKNDSPFSGGKVNNEALLSEEEFSEYHDKLETVMKEKQPYLNEDLTLIQLASEIGLTDKKLSALLNQYLGYSFYDFINKYRIDEVKRKIANPKFSKYSLLGLAHLSGFKSKSSFYRSFKKFNHMLPAEYGDSLSEGSPASKETA